MNSISPGIGDTLLYQRRGDDILAAIEKKIVELSADSAKLVVLGHSLGGIMLVDLLSRQRPAGRLKVSKLITVGSQSPMLLKFDALGSMRRKGPFSPEAPFTPWLNVFDRNDFLSFCGSRAFPGIAAGIDDFEVASGVPFPDAHSAYFSLDTLYTKIAATWP
jgi:pimeloyl-ACP methyl ester carboxylesterase